MTGHDQWRVEASPWNSALQTKAAKQDSAGGKAEAPVEEFPAGQ